MSDDPTVIGINRTQDASIAVAAGPSTVYSIQKERITRRKHHWGRLGDLANLYLPALPALREPVDLVVECYSSDSEVERLPAYRDELTQSLTFRDGVRVAMLSHHLAHLYSAFYPSPFERAAVMVVDAQGSRVKDVTETFPAPDAGPDLLEVASFYSCERGRVECLGKHLWHGNWAEPAGLGCFYYLLTRTIFPGEGNEGKVMGLAPFGRPYAFALPELGVDEYRVSIPAEWLEIFADRARFAFFSDGSGSFSDCANLAAVGQRVFETALMRVADWLYDQTGAANLCFAGGTALNCTANGRLLHDSGFDAVFIPPSPHDGGTALGCALYGMIDCLGEPSEFRWVNDFLGPDLDARTVEEALRAAPSDLVVEEPVDLVDEVARLLESGRVVGLHQGRSESGPRALGNRSIIADARRPGMQRFINSHVKGREWFRPLAPIVLANAAATIFDVDRPAPFMQYAADVRPAYRAALPAITHVDGSARLQTVEDENTPFLYELLHAFAARTGVPVLLNTSLNRKGDPLVETPQEALTCLQQTSMHALAMPPYLVRKQIEPPLPNR
ncbi:carbamoyltransferase [Planosporangium flavigriseum]|uniref:Transferase n=1 Tax=Planosporangium flavigriseum TaxID=373681 RepID=A0A8J3PKG6_9ACTN|nr:carbamoyltransferase C-terminal domain-containing protein [Planosporangium flavigriseum]NJC65309.1 carbamoyltransferase [Planosporangium flavigriseum]GIG73336.1 transferase [Planosporangium flavigriseum]